MTIRELSKNGEEIFFARLIKEFYGDELMKLVELEGGTLEVNPKNMQYDFRHISDSLQKKLDAYREKKIKDV